MKTLFLLSLALLLQASGLENIQSFEADFTQSITNDKNTTLTYTGHVKASKPQLALWQYKTPVEKTIYITNTRATVVEPELEQVYLQKINATFDFFRVLKHAKKIAKNTFSAKFQDTQYTLKMLNNTLFSISYRDELDNSVLILFKNQHNNKVYKKKEFEAKIPLDYDIIQG